MHRYALLFVLMLASIAASAQVKKYTLEVGDFHELTVADDINVVYRYLPDSAGMAMFMCEPQMARILTFVNNKEKLKIELTRGETFDGTVPTVYVYSSGLSKVVNRGTLHVEIAELNTGTEFKGKVIGNGSLTINGVHVTRLECAVETGRGTVTASGVAREAKYTMAGKGGVDAADMSVDDATCWMVGTGYIRCQAAARLSVYGAGSGTVYYTGHPEIKKRSMGVKVVDITDAPDQPAE